MANEEHKISPESRAMAGGTGSLSYNQNSTGQKEVMDAAKEIIRQGITNHLELKNPNLDSLNPFRIADFGCSVGPNTFSAVENIIEAVNLKHDKISDPLEFHVFFNDVTGNDFNTLFKCIPSPTKYFAAAPTKYLAAGVPGSLYRRLFPCSSLHIAHSCYSLHWLSTVPEEVADKNSAAWNKDNIYCTGLDAEVTNANSKQFKKDMDTFLSARAEDIVEGGLLVILMAGLPDEVLLSQTAAGSLYSLLGSCLVDLAKLGVLSEEKVDSFSLPLHYAYAEELEEVVKSNGCFTVEDMKKLRNPWTTGEKWPIKFIVGSIRAVFGGVIKHYFGNDDEEQVDLIFRHFTDKVADNFFLPRVGGHEQIEHFILLKRNSN